MICSKTETGDRHGGGNGDSRRIRPITTGDAVIIRCRMSAERRVTGWKNRFDGLQMT